MAQEPGQEDKNAGQDKEGKPGWPATLGRALRANAALIAALLALAGVLITQVVTTNNAREGLTAQRELEESRMQTQQQLEEDRAREAELQTYLDDMGAMLLDEGSPLPEAEPGGPMSSLARAKTLTILERLDSQRKGIVLQFLYESQLVQKGKPVVGLAEANLQDADLSNATLQEADLTEADLSGAYLNEANLRGASLYKAEMYGVGGRVADLYDADLTEADLYDAFLHEADLSGASLYRADLGRAFLIEADLSGAKLSWADLRGAYLEDADLSDAWLRDADLSYVRGVTDEQLAKAETLAGATMPDGSKHD